MDNSSSTLSGRTTLGSFFEGLFVHALKASGDFAHELRAVGFDVQKPRALYPIEVWNAALQVAWRRCFPELGQEAAYRELGRQLAIGFSETRMGRVLVVGLPILGPERFVNRIPSLCAIDTFRYRVKVEPLALRHYLVHFRDDPDAKPDLMAGLFEEGLRRTGVTPSITVAMRAAQDFDLEVRW